MGRYQITGLVSTDGAGTPVALPTPLMPGDAQAITAISVGATVALADRIGFDVDIGAASVDLAPPPNPVPPAAVLCAARFLHSLPAGARAEVVNVAIPAGAPGVASYVHNLGAVPDFISAVPDAAIPGVDWAVTAITDAAIDFANWDAVNAIQINLYVAHLHSIDTPLESMPMQIISLNGVAPVTFNHGLGRTPDYLGVFPWAPGLVQPAGLPVLAALPDDTEISLGGNFAGALMDVKVYAQATHSIQA